LVLRLLQLDLAELKELSLKLFLKLNSWSLILNYSMDSDSISHIFQKAKTRPYCTEKTLFPKT
jgi:hypothetical protein